jgi:hypothetical protein
VVSNADSLRWNGTINDSRGTNGISGETDGTHPKKRSGTLERSTDLGRKSIELRTCRIFRFGKL